MQAIIIFLLLSVPFSWVLAAGSLSVVINEITWMGTEESYSDEWIELYNNSTNSINLEGWQLISGDGTPEIDLKGKIPAQGFFLLERTDDEAVPDIEADLIYKGALENEGEYLKLTDSRGNVIDEIDCSTGWFAGDNTPKKTMERKNPLVLGPDPENWQTSQNAGGTPKAGNSQKEETKEITTLEEPEQSPPQMEEITYTSNIFINEILPSPEGADAENEWLELFNGNNFEVTLSGWQIRDTVGAAKSHTILEGTKIDSNGFLVLSRTETKITLQNSGDSLELLNPDREVVGKINYPKAPLGQSFNRISTGWNWSTTLTPGETNVITTPGTQETGPSQISKERESQTKSSQSAEEKEAEKLLTAGVGEKLPKTSNPLIIFFVALIIAVSSAIIVLVLKKRATGEDIEGEF